MTVDDIIIQTFEWYGGPEYLPSDPTKLDQLVRYAIGKLSDESAKAKRILKDIAPEKSANYLVKALTNPERREPVIELLKYYGASKTTVGPLVMALANPERRGAAMELLQSYGSSKITVGPLVGALANPECRELVIELLKYYGVSEITVRPLVGALANPECKDDATQVLLHFGKKCLGYIKEEKPNSELYTPLTELIRSLSK